MISWRYSSLHPVNVKASHAEPSGFGIGEIGKFGEARAEIGQQQPFRRRCRFARIQLLGAASGQGIDLAHPYPAETAAILQPRFAVVVGAGVVDGAERKRILPLVQVMSAGKRVPVLGTVTENTSAVSAAGSLFSGRNCITAPERGSR
ncbi:hypothetical protein NKI89_06630 [Mesorhizobium sp. M0309]|uniref:hypothetical protein n=1 Tax=Mesorhizobium sp. M0309 TaxID=2956933 RepID=UPI00333874C3